MHAESRHVLLLAFTNHALDHILRAIHDSGMTRRLARLGSRSKDEVIAGYSLDRLERNRSKMDYDYDISRAYREVKIAESVSMPSISTGLGAHYDRIYKSKWIA